MRKSLRVVFFFMIVIQVMSGQKINSSIIATSGDDFQKDQIRLQWTLGETPISRYDKSGLKLEEGFLSGLPKSALSTFVFQLPEIGQLTLAPNPTLGKSQIQNIPENASGEYYIFNQLGQKIETKLVVDKSIDMSHLQDGLYYILFLTEQKQGFLTRAIKQSGS